MMTRRQVTVETVTALFQNSSMMLIVGIITLAAGLAVVLAHNIWSGGALVVVVIPRRLDNAHQEPILLLPRRNLWVSREGSEECRPLWF